MLSVPHVLYVTVIFSILTNHHEQDENAQGINAVIVEP